jgi:RTX calcium-binding nonapeptide repeat (4 copies)
MNTINETYINALLADASYVKLRNDTELLSADAQKAALAARLTQPQADFITANFIVKNQELSPTGGFDAVVWQGKADTAYAGKTYVSMRGTQGGQDIADDISLAVDGVPSKQIVSMVNWWLRETAPAGQIVKQIKWDSPTVLAYSLDTNTTVIGTGVLADVTSIEQVNGHSLGGYLSTAFVRLFGNAWNVGHTTTFNSAGFNNLPGTSASIAQVYTKIQSLIGTSLGRNTFNDLAQQDNFYAQNGPNVTTHDSPVGFTQYGKRTALFQEDLLGNIGGVNGVDPITNHYMYKQTDLLALGAALEKLDPNLTFDTLNALIKAGSTDMKASYEGVLDGLRKTILGQFNIASTDIGDVGNNADSRVNFHQNLATLQDSHYFQLLEAPAQTFVPGQAALQSKVTIRATAGYTELANKAKTNFSDFLALYNLSPLVLESSATNSATLDATLGANQNTLLLNAWMSDYALRANGKPPKTFTDDYLNDRQDMLQALQLANIHDDFNLNGEIILSGQTPGPTVVYQDTDVFGKVTTITMMGSTPLETAQHIIFGSDKRTSGTASKPVITGSAQADRIYGGFGDDVFKGNNGNDTLIGGTGFDTYAFGSAALIKATPAGSAATDFGNDKIYDTDGLGKITIDGQTITGGSHITPYLNRLYPEIAMPTQWAQTYYTDNEQVMMQIMNDNDPASTTGKTLWIVRVTDRADIWFRGTILMGTITVKNFDVIKAKTDQYLGIHLGDEMRPAISCKFSLAKALLPFGIASRRDPLMLDLNGDGIINHVGLEQSNTFFDHLANGIRSQTGWVDKGDGILVLDGGLNGQANGSIDNGSELFGDHFVKANGQLAKDGFDALASLDSNADGYVDAQDSAFARLKVWVDANGDGISQDGELRSLANAYVDTAGNPTGVGITRFNVTPSSTVSTNTANGNQTASAGSFVTSTGAVGVTSTGTMQDINLAHNNFYSQFTTDIPLTTQAQTLAYADGAGYVRSTQEAASLQTAQGAAFAAALQRFSTLSTRSAQMAAVDELLLSWAATSGMATLGERIAAYNNANPANLTAGTAANPSYQGLQWAQSQALANQITILEAFNGQYLYELDGVNGVNIAANEAQFAQCA